MAINTESYVISPKLADHFAIACVLDKTLHFSVKKIKFRNFCYTNKCKFFANIENILSTFVIPMNNVNNAFKTVETKFKNIANEFFPIKHKSISVKRLSMPWLTSKLIKCINKKHKWLTLLKRHIITYESFKTYSTLLNNVLSIAERQYYRNSLSQSRGDHRKHWNIVNKLLGRNSKKCITEMKINDEITDNPETISNYINEYFISIPHIVQTPE